MYFFEVYVASKYATSLYIYSSFLQIEDNCVVQIEFRKSVCLGICIRSVNKPEIKNIKEIQKIFSYKISNEVLEFCKQTANYNLTTIGSILEMMLPNILIEYANKNQSPLPLILEENGKMLKLDDF